MLPDLVLGEMVGSGDWWHRVAELGTPLPFPEGLRRSDGTRTGIPTLVFLAREADHPLVYVDLNGLTDRSDPAAGTMTAVPGTDVHIAAFAVQPDYVGSYTFIPVNGPLESPAARDTPQARAWWLSVLAGSRTDPFARGRRYEGQLGGACAIARLGEAPQAPATGGHDLHPLIWHRPDGIDQRVWLWLPDAAEVGLALLFDGHMWAERLPVGPVIADLHHRGAIPPTAAVLVDPLTPQRRRADLAGADVYLDYLVGDLLPLIDAELSGRGVHRSPDPARTVVAGQSFGGLAAFRLAARHPEVCGASISQSGSFWWPGPGRDAVHAMATWLSAQPPRRVRTVIQVGAYEGLLCAANRELAGVIADRGEHLVFTEVPGGHDWAWWIDRLGEALVAALGE